MTQQPLAGIRVTDLTRVLAGPYCTMILKDLGAQVIKVEATRGGDDARHFGPFLKGSGQSAYFMSINCGKKSVAVNLKTDSGKMVLQRLIRVSDVLVENFRPGTLARLGFDDQTIRGLNPQIVLASASGFGHSGPDSQNAAYDVVIQALSGLMSITGTEEGQSVRVGSSISDIVTGMYAAIGIVAALYRRGKTGMGARLDLAMLDSTVSVLENAIARYQATGTSPEPLGARHPSITPFEAFATKDGSIVICAGNDRLFASLCKVINMPGLVNDPRFKTNEYRTANFQALREMLNRALQQETTAHWLEALGAGQVPCGKINKIEDLFDYQQLRARNMLIPVEGEERLKAVGNPIKFIGEEDQTHRAQPPNLGEHNEQILGELLGYSAADIDTLYQQEVISKAWVKNDG